MGRTQGVGGVLERGSTNFEGSSGHPNEDVE